MIGLGLYTIGEVARLLNVSPSSLRVWESTGLISKSVRKGIGRRRAFTQSQLEEIQKFIEENYRSYA